MGVKRLAVIFLVLFFISTITACADKKVMDINARKLAEYSDSRGQANLKLYMYSSNAEIKDIEAYTDKLGCNMLFAYFYPDTVATSEIPVEEIRSAKSFVEAREILFNGEGYASWRFAARCFAAIPIVTDCKDGPLAQNCR